MRLISEVKKVKIFLLLHNSIFTAHIQTAHKLQANGC